MNRRTMKILLAVCLGIVVLLTSSVVAGGKKKGDAANGAPIAAGSLPNVTFLPREISKSLDITSVPTPEPIPLIVGSYWRCTKTDQDFEICRFRIVVCTDDQSFCTEIP